MNPKLVHIHISFLKGTLFQNSEFFTVPWMRKWWMLQRADFHIMMSFRRKLSNLQIFPRPEIKEITLQSCNVQPLLISLGYSAPYLCKEKTKSLKWKEKNKEFTQFSKPHIFWQSLKYLKRGLFNIIKCLYFKRFNHFLDSRAEIHQIFQRCFGKFKA